jgi:hypothetical protein
MVTLPAMQNPGAIGAQVHRRETLDHRVRESICRFDPAASCRGLLLSPPA